MGLFDAPTGPGQGSATALTSGSPDYQKAVVQNATNNMKPAYNQALRSSMQMSSDNGQLGGGTDQANRLGLQENFLGQVGNVATNAATQGADLAEQNRQRVEQRGWQTQDRDLNLQYLKDQANQNQANMGQQQWANLIGQGAGAVGTIGGAMLGGPVGAAAGGAAGQGLGSLLRQKPVDMNSSLPDRGQEQRPGYTPF